MQHDPRAHLADVLEAAELIGRFTRGVEFDGYRIDAMMQSAVERQLEIVGEALNRLAREAPDLVDRIPDIRRIVGSGTSLRTDTTSSMNGPHGRRSRSTSQT